MRTTISWVSRDDTVQRGRAFDGANELLRAPAESRVPVPQSLQLTRLVGPVLQAIFSLNFGSRPGPADEEPGLRISPGWLRPTAPQEDHAETAVDAVPAFLADQLSIRAPGGQGRAEPAPPSPSRGSSKSIDTSSNPHTFSNSHITNSVSSRFPRTLAHRQQRARVAASTSLHIFAAHHFRLSAFEAQSACRPSQYTTIFIRCRSERYAGGQSRRGENHEQVSILIVLDRLPTTRSSPPRPGCPPPIASTSFSVRGLRAVGPSRRERLRWSGPPASTALARSQRSTQASAAPCRPSAAARPPCAPPMRRAEVPITRPFALHEGGSNRPEAHNLGIVPVPRSKLVGQAEPARHQFLKRGRRPRPPSA